VRSSAQARSSPSSGKSNRDWLLWLPELWGYHVFGDLGKLIAGTAGLLHHVRRLKLLTVLLTLLTLPGYGLAGIAHVRSCQSQMSSSLHIAVAGDCCPGKAEQNTPCKQFGDGSGKNGACTPCKAGYNCKSTQSYEPTHVVALPIIRARPILTADFPTLLISHLSNGLWRPPRPI